MEIQFYFWNSQRFKHGLVGEIGKSCFWGGPKIYGISKIKLDFPNIDWKFKSLGHKLLNELESFSLDTTCGTIKVKINTITKLKKNPIFSKVIIAF